MRSDSAVSESVTKPTGVSRSRPGRCRRKKIGLTKSLNTIKNDWWRIQEEQGVELMLRLNGMTRYDVDIVEFPCADDWYDDPKMLDPIEYPSEL